MQLPFFYAPQLADTGTLLELDEDSSRHIVSVLRMKEEEQLHLTDGKGNLVTATIADAHKKHCSVHILSSTYQPEPERKTTVAISLLKNISRFEWFLEKATELGVYEIAPLLCSRTERQHFRQERMQGVLISAMLQSRQCWLPQMHAPMAFNQFLSTIPDGTDKLIAHCEESEKHSLALFKRQHSRAVICIGPEGDFDHGEISSALEQQFIPVSLGQNRLRTETAAVVAATLLQLV